MVVKKKYKIKPKEEIRFRDVWYRPGDEMPLDYDYKESDNIHFKKKVEVI